MLNPWLKQWVWTGVTDSLVDDICPTRLTNLIGLVFIAMVLLHLPLALWFWREGGHVQVVFCAVSALCGFLVIASNARRWPTCASALLVAAYMTYFTLTAAHVGGMANTHVFLLLAPFAIPFLFAPDKYLFTRTAMAMAILLFVLFEFNAFEPLGVLTNVKRDYARAMALSNVFWLSVCAGMCAYQIHRNLYQSRQKLRGEQQRAESLLLNVLPGSVAKRLKWAPTSSVESCHNATVLFADIQGFTALANTTEPLTLAQFLNRVFTTFDCLCDEHGIEKIKTIGDAYMAAAGLPVQRVDHALRCCRCAFAMQMHFDKIRRELGVDNGLRIGIASGPVIAGIIGARRFSYDVWGATVNLAARLQTKADINGILIADGTRNQLPQGQLPSRQIIFDGKGIGTVTAYQLSPQPWLSAVAQAS